MLSSPPPPRRPPLRPAERVPPRTLRGTIGEATGCTVIETPFGRWALVGRVPDDLTPGTRVEIRARARPQHESACGAPVLAVDALTRL